LPQGWRRLNINAEAPPKETSFDICPQCAETVSAVLVSLRDKEKDV
jgi:hypothetical protein